MWKQLRLNVRLLNKTRNWRKVGQSLHSHLSDTELVKSSLHLYPHRHCSSNGSKLSPVVFQSSLLLKNSVRESPNPEQVCHCGIAGTSIGNRYFHIDQTKGFSASSANRVEQLIPGNLSKNEYEAIAEDTLESLTTYFDEIVEQSSVEDTDVSYGSGVLTIKLGSHGTYVINKQAPNKQIWLSSPTSGPKRYDFINNTWIYKHDGVSMYHLLNSEIPGILQLSDIDFSQNCSFGEERQNK